jgi:hypothetical protein
VGHKERAQQPQRERDAERLNGRQARGAGRVGEKAGARGRDADGGVNCGRVLVERGAEVAAARGMTERLNAGRRRARRQAGNVAMAGQRMYRRSIHQTKKSAITATTI